MILNQVYLNTSDQKRFRVFKIVDDLYYCMDLPLVKKEDGTVILKDNKYENPYVIDRENFIIRIQDGDFVLIPDPFRNERKMASLKEKVNQQETSQLKGKRNKTIEKATLIVNVAKDIIENYVDELLVPKRKEIIYKEVAEKYKISANTVRKYLTTYICKGMDITGVFPDYKNIGNKGQRKKHKRIPGPTPKNEIQSGSPLNMMIPLYDEVIEENLSKGYRDTADDILAEVIKRNFIIQEDENGNTLRDLRAPKDSQQLRYYIRTEEKRDPEKFLKATKTEREYNREHRNHYHTIDEDCEGIMQMGEIDSTILPVYLVATFDNHRVVGQPTLFLLIDVRSRLITGYDLSYDPASWNSALRALVNCCSDKVKHCKGLGITITDEIWPCQGRIFQEIYADNAEFKSLKAERLSTEINSEIINVPAFRGDLKPLVERRFRRPSEFLRNRIMGGIPKDVLTREDKDFKEYARLNLKQLERIVVEQILTYNQMTVEGLIADVYQFTSMKKYSPLDLWNLDSSMGLNLGVPEKPEYLQKAILPEHSGKIRNGRIYFKNLVYIPDDEHKAWVDNLNESEKRVRFLYSESDTSYIYVLDEKVFRRFSLIKKQKDFMEIDGSEYSSLSDIRNGERYFDKQDNIILRGKLNECAKTVQKEAMEEWKKIENRSNNLEERNDSKAMERAITNPALDEYTVIETFKDSESNDDYKEIDFDVFDFNDILDEVNG